MKNYDTFVLYSLLEKVDYEWDFERGVEIDHRNNIKTLMVNSLKKSNDKAEWFENLLHKLEGKSKYFKLAALAFIAPIIINSTNLTQNDVIDTSNKVSPEISKEVEKIVKDKEEVKTISLEKFNPLKLEPSEELIDFLKDEEKLRLTAYRLGDGHVTIGYGHAEPIKKSKYKVGDTITEKQAERLFRKDLKRTAKGVKRLFKKWNKEDINIELTQSQFDAMVSMAYNMGVGGLRASDFVLLVKQNKMKEAAEKIKTTNVNKKFGGLAKRRAKESEMFSRSL